MLTCCNWIATDSGAGEAAAGRGGGAGAGFAGAEATQGARGEC